MIFKENPPVITGIGVATSIGTRKLTFLNNLEKGRSGLRYIEGYDFKKLPVKKAFVITDPIDYNNPEKDPHINFALHAAKEALTDSGLTSEYLRQKKIATVVSSSKGGMRTFEEIKKDSERYFKSQNGNISFQKFTTDGVSSEVAREFGLNGFTKNTVAACATGLHSIISGAMSVAIDDADISISGATDASITPLMLSGYHKMKVYSHDDVRPFDKRRSGFIIGEGAGVVILEKHEEAKARNASLYAKIRGFLLAQDPGTMVQHNSDENVLQEAIKRLLKEAGLIPRDIQYVCLHGTSTILGDQYEAEQCEKAFGSDIKKIRFNAPKSLIGHMLGASGAVETIITALSIKNKIIFPTINSARPDTFVRFDLNYNKLTKHPIQYALKISMGFGGHIALLLLEK